LDMKRKQFEDPAKYRVNLVAKEDSDDEPQKEKWNTLEHHGVSFFPGYEPHGVKLLFKGKPIDIRPEVEEICNWWAVEEGSEFASKERV